MTQPSQADILAALQAQSGSRKVRPPTTLLSEHEKDGGSPKDLLKGNPGESSKKTNAGKIFCWREGCGCLILSPGVGEWLEDEPNIVRRSSHPLHESPKPRFRSLKDLMPFRRLEYHTEYPRRYPTYQDPLSPHLRPLRTLRNHPRLASGTSTARQCHLRTSAFPRRQIPTSHRPRSEARRSSG